MQTDIRAALLRCEYAALAVEETTAEAEIAEWDAAWDHLLTTLGTSRTDLRAHDPILGMDACAEPAE